MVRLLNARNAGRVGGGFVSAGIASAVGSLLFIAGFAVAIILGAVNHSWAMALITIGITILVALVVGFAIVFVGGKIGGIVGRILGRKATKFLDEAMAEADKTNGGSNVIPGSVAEDLGNPDTGSYSRWPRGPERW